MGWNGSLDASSALGAKITYTPDTSSEGAYAVTSFTAPKKGVYRFQLKGSGGTGGTYASGGSGGSTDGYLLLEKGQTAYIGAGGPCSAAFVSSASGSSLSAIGSGNLYFVAGGGGGGGVFNQHSDYTQWGSGGGNGGGSSGAKAENGGYGGTQSGGGAASGSYNSGNGSAGAYGKGGLGSYVSAQGGAYATGGRGGDGYYGGGSGYSVASHNSGTGATSSYAFDGGGGSGYVKTASFSLLGKTYTSSTSQGGGAGSGANGSVSVTYYARALLPVFFDGVQLERLFINGTEAEGLVYDGVIVYMRSIARRIRRWLNCLRSMGRVSA